jgi:hypothetical protein
LELQVQEDSAYLSEDQEGGVERVFEFSTDASGPAEAGGQLPDYAAD